uniref:Uncharacterized protein n=1 Tax=Knipowitschia caucasica TaxID=637954 RepID=A0AAV2IX11_KNICA
MHLRFGKKMQGLRRHGEGTSTVEQRERPRRPGAQVVPKRSTNSGLGKQTPKSWTHRRIPRADPESGSREKIPRADPEDTQ